MYMDVWVYIIFIFEYIKWDESILDIYVCLFGFTADSLIQWAVYLFNMSHNLAI